MSGKKKYKGYRQAQQPAAAPPGASPPLHGDEDKAPLRMRLPAGKYAVQAAEAEVRVDGARVAGGNGSFEFDLFKETWVEIIHRPPTIA